METITHELIARMLRKAGHTTTILPIGIVELPHKNLIITIEGQKIVIGPTYGLSPIAEFDVLPSAASVRTMIAELERRNTRSLELADPSFEFKLLAIIELGFVFDNS